MINQVFKTALFFIVMVLIQVLLLNNIHLFNIAVPFLYMYFILRISFRYSRNWVLFLSFLLGLTIDFFFHTLGVHAAACTLIALVRYPLVGVVYDKEIPDDLVPSIRSFGFGAYFRYMIVMVCIHHVAIFLLESFDLSNIGVLLKRMLASIVLTSLMILIVEVFSMYSSSSKGKNESKQ